MPVCYIARTGSLDLDDDLPHADVVEGVDGPHHNDVLARGQPFDGKARLFAAAVKDAVQRRDGVLLFVVINGVIGFLHR